jgi:hypothetical protein
VINRVFLGGTCAHTTWRNQIIPQLTIDYFNPDVEDWTEACQAIEMDEKDNKCNVHFYLISKEMQGVFSIAEVVNSAHTHGKRTILHVRPDGFDKGQLKSLKATVELVNAAGGIAYIDNNIHRAVTILNNCFA